MNPKTFKASTAKQVLSQISRELGPDAIIVSHRKIQDSEGKLWVEATASPRAEVAPRPRTQPTTKEKIVKFSSKKLFVPALVFIALTIAGVLIWQLLPLNIAIKSIPQKLSVAVISFENQTGDDSYDYLNKVIPNLLITSLEQSGYFYVSSWERLHDLLKQMGNADLEVIDQDLGFELCQMDDIDAIVMGSFAKAGDMFVTDVKLLDVETKRILKSANSRGNGEESIIQSQIDELSREISQGIGFSEGKTERAQRPIADVTTNSLDAYYYFVRGQECNSNQNYKDGRKFLEKAIELDPRFAMAYLKLGDSLLGLGDFKATIEAYKKAKNFSARATEKERYFIDGIYAFQVKDDLEEGFRIFKKMVKHYPKEKSSHYGLGLVCLSKGLFNLAIEEFNKAQELDPYDGEPLRMISYSYRVLRNYEKAIEYLKKHMSVFPGNAAVLERMASIYLEMGKLDEASAKYEEAFEADPDRSPNWLASYVYALKEDYPEAMRWIDRSIHVAPPSQKGAASRGWNYLVKSFYHYWLGNLDESMSHVLMLIDYADTIKFKHWKANAFWMMGWISYERSEFESCRKYFKEWFDIYMEDVLPLRDNSAARKMHWTAWYYFYLGLVDLKQGKIKSARSWLVEIHSLLPDVLPQYKDWITFYYNFLHAEVLLAEGAVKKAITIGKKSSPLGGSVERGKLVLHNVPFLKDVLARAYRQNGEIDKAIAEYERLITFDPQREERYLIHPRYYYRLAELYEQKRERRKAGENYEKFLGFWENADPAIPEIVEAKKQLSKLRSEA